MNRLLFILLAATIVAFSDARGSAPLPVGFFRPASSGGSTLPVTAGLIARWEADAITGLNDGDPVPTWTDQSGNGHDAVQAGANKPVFKTGIFGSSPAVRFDGVDDYLTITSPTSVTNVTVFIVFSAPSKGGDFAGPINWRAAGIAGFHFNEARGSSGNFMPGFLKTDSGNSEIASKELSGGGSYPYGPVLAVCRYDSAITYRFQGAAGMLGLDAYTGYVTNARIGSVYSAAWKGDIGAILVYDVSLSDSDCIAVETYLNAKYPCY